MSRFPFIFQGAASFFSDAVKSTLQKWGRPLSVSPFLLVCSGVQAEEQVGARAFQASDHLGQVAFSLLLVIGLILVAAWLLRRFSQLPGAQGQAVRIISAIAVGRQEKVLLIEVGGEQLLIGVTPSRISTLHVLAEPVRLPDNADKVQQSFPRWLQHAVEQYGQSRKSGADGDKS